VISITEDGKESVLKPGDIVIQRGNIHAWKNPGPGWARWVTILIDADAAVVNGESMGNTWRA
jgi:quercetin dioxygenase-like cupin family protein